MAVSTFLVGDPVSEKLVVLGIIVSAGSGVLGLLSRRASMYGQYLSCGFAVLGSGCGLGGVATFWITGDGQAIVRPWSLPGAEFNVAIDGLSAIFLLPIFLISLLGNIYGLAYWKQTEHPHNGRKLRLFYGILTSAMALLIIARNAVLFLFGWEIMALSAFFLVTTEEQDREVRETGWIYLVATHTATLFLFALFALFRSVSGSFTLATVADGAMTPTTATVMFVLALAGFGIKAGIMPLHVWLPSSHAIAPSHVSAIMSGVIIKMGIYGLVRITSLLPNPPLAWGGTVLSLGVVSGVLGVAFAIGQHDLKRLLAYHSIENIGIIVMGLGLALIGRSTGRADWIVLGLSGCLLHVWNHALFKALLFLSAGSVIHAVHTREIDQLGGLAKRMPRTAHCFLIGAIAICGLPPLNGFVSELLIYLGLFATLGNHENTPFAAASFAIPALALIGTLAVACFVKVYGTVFLGTARHEHARPVHEAPFVMIGPMFVLVACCFLIGLAPSLIAPILEKAVYAWDPSVPIGNLSLTRLAPLNAISALGLLLLVGVFLGSIALWSRLRNRVVASGPTWGCGFAAPTSRMQYTSSSYADTIVGIFAWALRPRSHGPRPRELSLFPRKTAFHSEVPDPVLDEAVLPAFRFAAVISSWFFVFQRGSIQSYLLYIFVALVALLIWH